MFQLDEKFLQEIGLDKLPEEQKKPFLQHIYDELEMRVGTKLSEGMTEFQLNEFESIIDNNEQSIDSWLQLNTPNYSDDPIFQKLQSAHNVDANNLSLKSEFAASKWLEINSPDYKQVVASVLNSLKNEVLANKDVILGNN